MPKMAGCVPVGEMNSMSLEVEHVHRVYSEIAKHFSHTRHKPWPEIAAFIDSLAPGSFLADVGEWDPSSQLNNLGPHLHLYTYIITHLYIIINSMWTGRL